MRPDDIPQDVWDAAIKVATAPRVTGALFSENYVLPVARAILAERERCARFVEIFPTRGSTPEMAEHAASEARSIAAAIRKGGE